MSNTVANIPPGAWAYALAARLQRLIYFAVLISYNVLCTGHRLWPDNQAVSPLLCLARDLDHPHIRRNEAAREVRAARVGTCKGKRSCKLES